MLESKTDPPYALTYLQIRVTGQALEPFDAIVVGAEHKQAGLYGHLEAGEAAVACYQDLQLVHHRQLLQRPQPVSAQEKLHAQSFRPYVFSAYPISV